MTLQELLKRHESDIRLQELLMKINHLCDLQYSFNMAYSSVMSDIGSDFNFLLNREDSNEDPNIYEFKDLYEAAEEVNDAFRELDEKFYLLLKLEKDKKLICDQMMKEYKERAGNLTQRMREVFMEANDEQ